MIERILSMDYGFLFTSRDILTYGNIKSIIAVTICSDVDLDLLVIGQKWISYYYVTSTKKESIESMRSY